MRILIHSITLILVAQFCYSQSIVINETMPAPEGEEPEWIELFNNLDYDITIEMLLIADPVKEVELHDFLIKAKGYVVLTSDSTALKANRYVDPETIVVESSLPIMNNSGDVLTLKDSDGLLLDSMDYKFNSSMKGTSIERIYPDGVENLNNFDYCVDESGATCGGFNSIATYDSDIELADGYLKNDSLFFSINNPTPREMTDVEFQLLSNLSNEPEVVYLEVIKPNFVHNHSLPINIFFDENEIKELEFIQLTLIYELDPNKENNVIRFTFDKPIPAGVLKINEILYDVPSGKAEFVEIYNSHTSRINLNGLIIYDQNAYDNDKPSLVEEDVYINPADYFVIAWNESIVEEFPHLAEMGNIAIAKPSVSLNKSDDLVLIRFKVGFLQDSLVYEDGWHSDELTNTREISLEKKTPGLESVNENSWQSCADESGATPGKPNSTLTSAEELDIKAEPNPFSISAGEVCTIIVNLEFSPAIVYIRIFDLNGREIRELTNTGFKSGEFTIEWDGRNDSGGKMPPGPYIFLLEARAAGGNEMLSGKAILVIGG